MAKFYNKGPAIFQAPEEKIATDGSKSVSMGFRVAECDDAYNASVIVRCLNQDDEFKKLAAWLLKQKTLHLNKERREFLEKIVDLK